MSVTAPIDRSGPLVDAAVKAGANGVSGPSLALSDQDALYATALKNAIANADAKAKTIADAAGPPARRRADRRRGQLPDPGRVGRRRSRADAPSTITVEPGTQEVDATVTVTYAAG